MRNKTKTALAAIAAYLSVAICSNGGAFNYSDGDVLLTFYWHNSNVGEAVYDVGSISNYLNLTAGTVVGVTNWNKQYLTNSSGTYSFTNASFSLTAISAYTSTSPCVWVTVAATNVVPVGIYGARFQSIWSRINGGIQAIDNYYTNNYSYDISTNEFQCLNDWVYSQKITGSQDLSDTATYGGSLPFAAECRVPGSLMFYQLAATNSPLPSAVKVGSFSMSQNGVLTFTAGN